MGRIHVTEGSNKVFIEDETLAVWVTKVGLVKGLRDAGLVLDVAETAVHKAIVNKESIDGHKVRYATLKETQNVFPGYRVVRHGKTVNTRARPTTAFYRGGDKRCHGHYRSMTTGRSTLHMSVTDFDIISSKQPGWRKRLFGCLEEIKVQKEGWELPDGEEFSVGRDDDPLFRLRLRANGSVGVKYIGPDSYPDFNSLPSQVLETAES